MTRMSLDSPNHNSTSTSEIDVNNNQESTIREPSTQNKLGFLLMAPGVTWTHLCGYLLGALFTICFFVFLNASQTFVLGDILQYPSSELGQASGSLVFYDELPTLFLVAIWGFVSDKVGRNIVYSVGYLFVAAALFAYPWARTLYPELLIFRLIFAVGGAACSAMLTAVLADIASDEHRGKLSGLVGLMSGLGALVALFILLPLPARFGKGVQGLRFTYAIAGAIALLLSVFLIYALYRIPQGKKFRIKREDSDAGGGGAPLLRNTSSSSIPPDSEANGELEPNIHSALRNSTTTSGQSNETWSTWIAESYLSAKEGILAGKHPLILLGYFAAFMARADSIIISTFLPLWVYKYYLNNGLCNATSPDDPGIKDLCRDAYVLASILSGVAQTFALIGAPIFGIIADRMHRGVVVIIATLLGGIGYLLLFIQSNPKSPILYIVVLFLGLGEIGLIVSSLTLVTASSFIPPHVRGSVAGISSFFGAAGILTCTKLGGYLFDKWTEGGPFILLAILHGVLFVVAIALISIHNQQGRARQS